MSRRVRVYRALLKDREAIARRFWRHVKKTRSCWEWTGFLKPNGYGLFRVYGTARVNGTEHAHRLSYMLSSGPLLDGENVCHHCDNKRCVRPCHLFKGSQSDNLLDAGRKGMMAREVQGEKHPNAKISNAAVHQIRARWIPRTRGLAATLAIEFNICKGHVQNIAYGATRR